MKSKVYILGAGAIGCLLASHFYRSHISVMLILKDKNSKDIYQKAGGITLFHGQEKFFYPVPACLAEGCADADFIFVTTKAFQAAQAIKNIQPYLQKNTWIVFLNNGLGCHEEILNFYPQLLSFLGMHYCAAIRKAPFLIEQVHLSPFYIGVSSPTIEPPAAKLIKIFKKSKLEIFYEENILFDLWKKFAANCIINPLTTLLQCKNGKLKEESLQSLIHDLCQEFILVTQKLRIPLELNELISFVLNIIEKTSDNDSSMLQDRQNRRQTEIDYLNGYFCQQAHKHNIPVPANKILLDLIRTLEKIYEKN